MPAEYSYRVSAWWTSGRTGLAKCESSPNTIHFSEAAELGGLQGRWTPEQLLLCSLAGCFTTTFNDVARASKFEYTDLEVEIEACVRRSRAAGCNFTEILIRPRLTVRCRRSTRSGACAAAPHQIRLHDFARHYCPADHGTDGGNHQSSGRRMGQRGRRPKIGSLTDPVNREGVSMMFSYRLVRLIESHADALAAGLEERVQASCQIAHFREIPAHEVRERVYEIYRHLGEWLLGKNELDIEHRYKQIGARRARQNVPLSEVVQAIVLTKENLWDFLKSEAVMDRAIEIMGELELLQMLEMFFDRAIYYAAVGYEDEVAQASRCGELRAV